MVKATPEALARNGRTPGIREVELVEYRGLLPRETAELLEGLSDWDRQHVRALPGSYEEVRSLLGAARLLHLYLKEGPLSAAHGRLTFAGFMAEKDALMTEILAFRRRLNGLAERAGLILPRFPQKKEVRHVSPSRLRAS